MNKDNLRELLAQSYTFENWKKVVDFVFPNVSYLQRPLTIPSDSDSVESFRQVGSVQLNDGKNLALFEVHVKPNVNIARNRVALRNLVSGYIDQERNHGVLAIYEKGTDEYRFTYTAKETDYDEGAGVFVQRETEAKRFTYILGANETCRTARDRFWELSQHKEEATIKDVENAFSVEKLSKEFFAKYKIQYTAFVDYLCNSTLKISAFKADEKLIRDFVKKMLGRIVFLHFVQKKGWLGASNAEYQDGDKQFMYQLWQNSNKDTGFYQLVLAPLFFDALNENHRPDDAFTFPDESILRIPFLGGGLFEKDREDPDWLTFPPALFESLFSFFHEYNFTIDENDPHENEVGIDPEMLGQIFENLLEDNKDKGAFYTPKPIVKYMCQESLIQYLLTAFEKEGIVTDETEKNEFEEKLSLLVKKYEAGEIIQYDRVLAEALFNVKICDPAIGSGAFPMGILNEMMMLINVLHNASPDVVEVLWKMDDWQPATVKKHIIQNSIYGVDIEKGAVDIARLRFWLSLIIDEEKPCSLPSLDYKIVVGNSLISKFEDEVIDIDWELKEEATQGNLFGDENEKARQKFLNSISKKQVAFYVAENHQKEKLALEIRNLKIDLLINQLQLQIKKNGLEKVPELSKSNVLKNQTEQYLKTQGWKQTIIKLENLKKHAEKPFQHFEWKLDFPEILNPEIAGETVGFHIVIGNPPYIPLEVFNIETREIFKKKYEQVERKYDTSVLFILEGYKLLTKKGSLSFIAPITWQTGENYSKFRRFLISNFGVDYIINLPFNTFENAYVETSLYNFIKGKLDKYRIYNFKKKEDYNNLVKVDFTTIQYSKLKEPTFRIILDTTSNDILERFSSESFTSLGLISKSTQGLSGSRFIETNLSGNEIFPFLKKGNVYNYELVILETTNTELSDKKSLQQFYQAEEKILIRRIVNRQDRLSVGFTERKMVFKKDINPFISINPDFPTKYLLAILASKYISYLYINSSTIATKDDFRQTTLAELRNIPIKITTPKVQKLFINIVDQILNLKLKNQNDLELEQQIDLMVYKIYILTFDEVLVVDPEFWMGKEEYDAFEVE